jgi:MFS family permease
MPAPLFSIYMVRYVDASDGWIALIGTVGGLVAAVANMFWGRLSHSRGNRLVLLITILGLVPHTLMFAATRQVEFFLPIGIIVNFFAAGMNISLYNSMLEVCPDEERPGYIAVYSALMNVAVFVAPLVGAQLAERIGIEVAFIVAAVLRLAGFALFAVLRYSPAAEQAPVEQTATPALELNLQSQELKSHDLVEYVDFHDLVEYEYIDEETARLHEPNYNPAQPAPQQQVVRLAGSV